MSNKETVEQLHTELAQAQTDKGGRVMSYGFMLFNADIAAGEKVPEINDLFRVTGITPGVHDMHFDQGVHIDLEPAASDKQLHQESQAYTDGILRKTNDELAEALTQARRELEDLQGANRECGRRSAAMEKSRDYWYSKALEAEAEWDKARKEAQALWDEAYELRHGITSAAKPEAQVTETGERAAREMLSRAIVAEADANLAAHINSKALDECMQTVRNELQLRQEAEQHAATLRCTLATIHSTLDDCQASGTYSNSNYPMSAKDCILLLGKRAKQAEALAAERAIQLEEAEHYVNDCRRVLTDVRGALDECQVEGKYDASAATMRITWLAQRAERGEVEVKQLQRRLALQKQRRDENYKSMKKFKEQAERAKDRLIAAHKTLDECSVKRDCLSGEPVGVDRRIFWLNRRADHNEALAALVNEETAGLLERLGKEANLSYEEAGEAGDSNTDWAIQLHADNRAARNLAKQIREARETLDDKQA